MEREGVHEPHQRKVIGVSNKVVESAGADSKVVSSALMGMGQVGRPDKLD